jgi:hypothetical protein
MTTGVTVDINANVARFSSSLDRVTQDLNRFQTNSQRIGQGLSTVFSGLGVGLAAGGFSAIIKSAIDTADSFWDLSKATAISVEQLSGLEWAAKLSGTTLEDVAGTINKLSVNIGKNGEKFRQLGIDATDPLEAFKQLADVFNQVEEPQQRAALAAAALGKSWQTVAPLLSEGGKAIGEMVKEGAGFSKITTQMSLDAGRFNDRLDAMQARIRGVGISLSGPVLDSFLKLGDYIGETNTQLAGASAAFSAYEFAIKSTAKVVAAAVDIFQRAGLGIGALAAKSVALATLDFNGFSVIDKAFEEDINNASARYDKFVKSLDNPASAPKLDAVSSAIKKPSQDRINAFIGGDGGGKVSKKSGGSSRVSSGIDNGERELQNLQRQIALFGEVGEAARVRYEIESGALGKISKSRQESLLATAEQLDAYREFDDILTTGNELAEKQRDSIKSTAEQANRLKLELADLSLPPSNEFEERLYKVDDALKAGIISAKEAKIELDKLGKLLNAGEFDDLEEKVSKLSEFAVQASRNLQTELASQLRSGFADGLDGALESFTSFLADAAAEYAASGILELVAGKDGKSGLLGSAVSGLGRLFGGFFASGGPISSGRAYVVGEKGPELFVPNTSGTIVPNNRLGSSSVSGGGTMDVSISTMVNVTGGNGNTNNMAALGGLINSRIRETIVTEKRPGGLLANA